MENLSIQYALLCLSSVLVVRLKKLDSSRLGTKPWDLVVWEVLVARTGLISIRRRKPDRHGSLCFTTIWSGTWYGSPGHGSGVIAPLPKGEMDNVEFM
jgi:hypothetical protein